MRYVTTVLLLAALALAGCGGSGGDDSKQTKAATPAATEAPATYGGKVDLICQKNAQATVGLQNMGLSAATFKRRLTVQVRAAVRTIAAVAAPADLRTGRARLVTALRSAATAKDQLALNRRTQRLYAAVGAKLCAAQAAATVKALRAQG